ncbi:MAG TPA: FMN-binding negative transcriptional regulator [Bryobacteraceae bacterium]
MYNPASFAETRPEIIEAAMASHPLATLVTAGSGGLEASHLPLLYYPAESGRGVLRGHMARANPQWREVLPGSEALAIFGGPQHYISPNWYPSKQEHGKVVPTWNYVVIHAHGPLKIRNEPEWLLENVRALSDVHESASETPWRVADAPPEFIANLLKAIVGVELTITRLEGKWKVSQNRPIADRHGVIRGLESIASSDADAMAALVKDKIGDM